MIELSAALQEIIAPERISRGQLVLAEEGEGNRCAPILVKCRRPHWGIRFADMDYLSVLAELPVERSVRKLPDYLLFSEPEEPPSSERDIALHVLVCELKSSERGAAAARRQVQLGKLAAHYLIRVALYQERWDRKQEPNVYFSGLIAAPGFPLNLAPKGSSHPRKVAPPSEYDKLSAMRIYHIPGGGEIHLESFF
jgi:hypothetical protein